MENSFVDASSQLNTVSRARVSAWAPKPIPVWYRAGTGIAAGCFWALQDTHKPVVIAVSTALYAIVIGVLVRMVARKQGSLTRPKGMPRRLQKAWAGSVLSMMIVIALCGGIVHLVNPSHSWVWFGAFGGAALFFGIDVGANAYKRSFERWITDSKGERP
jgi:peptidoglycan biosynthesis protein MviN/MurJ (putative lipid II flippase)